MSNNDEVKYILNTEDAEFIIDKIQQLLDTKAVYLYISYKKHLNADDFKSLLYSDYNGNKVQFMLYLYLNDNLSWDFGCFSDDREIFEYMQYPWNVSPLNVIKSYAIGRITRNDLNRYFEILENGIPILKEFIDKKFETEYRGTDKWIDAAKIWVVNTEKILNSVCRTFKVENTEYHIGNANHHFFNVVYTFNNNISYANKRRLANVLNEKLLPIYNKVNNYTCKDLKQCSWISYDFNDGGRKCADTKVINFNLRSNKWEALGMTEDAQYIPKMGMRKKIQI